VPPVGCGIGVRVGGSSNPDPICLPGQPCMPPSCRPPAAPTPPLPPLSPINPAADPVSAPREAATFSNSRSLSLAYEVANVGPSKLAGVEVYFTQDGQKWDRYRAVIPATGSVPVTVSEDGKFGFVLVARSQAGLSKPAPAAGDQPHLWVTVDTTRPQAELFEPAISGDNPGVVRLNWRVTDANLGDAPVALEWATTPGQWHAIVTGLPGKGSYSWAPPEEAGDRVNLRLTATDLAGNVTQKTTPEPVVIDAKVPSVTGVRLRQQQR
jgi:hypothetical protein